MIDKNITLNSPNVGGGSTIVYKNIIPGKIFKYSQYLPNKLFGYFLEYYLYNLINIPNYLCKNYEIGILNDNTKNDNFIYSIMDNCGEDIFNFFMKDKTTRNTYKSKINGENNILLNNLLIIFYKMCICVKILHDLGYAHLDIKPENFLISSIDGSNLLDKIFTENIGNIVLIKIIDFELVRKIGSKITTSKGFGTIQYAHNNLLKTNSSEVTISPIYDITSLRKSFIYIIGIIFFDNTVYQNSKEIEPERFNAKIVKILEALEALEALETLDSKPVKLNQLLRIFNDINIYTNIDFLLNALYCLVHTDTTPIDFKIKFSSSNNTIN